MKSLTQCLDVVTANRDELNPVEEEPSEPEAVQAKAAISKDNDYEDYTVNIDIDDED